MPRKKKKSIRRNCAVDKPQYTRVQFEAMAARGMVGPAVSLLDHPDDILSGRRAICLHSESLSNMAPDLVTRLQGAVTEGRLGYVIVHDGLWEVSATQTHIDGVEMETPIKTTLKAEQCTDPPRKDFSLGIFYEPAKVKKQTAEKLRDFLEAPLANQAAIGRILGYSEDDICAYYKQNFNYSRCVRDMNSATKAGACANTPPSKEEEKPTP